MTADGTALSSEATRYLAGEPLRKIASDLGRDRVKVAASIQAEIGAEAFQAQASANKRRGRAARFDPASVDLRALVRDWRAGASLIELRKRYRIPHARVVSQLICASIGGAAYRREIAARGRRSSAPTIDLSTVGHPLFRRPWVRDLEP